MLASETTPGKRIKTRHKMTRDQALKRDPTATPVPGTMEMREVPETAEDRASLVYQNLHYGLTVDRPCWTCHWYGGMTAQNTAALCSNAACCAVRSQPENGCARYEREPGSDDERHEPDRT